MEWLKVSVTRVTHCIKMKLRKHMTMFKHTINCESVVCRKVQYDLLTYTGNCYNHNSAMRDQLISVGCEALIQTGTIVTTEIMVVY